MPDDQFQRDLWRGSLALAVLAALTDGPQYGYAIQKAVREASNGQLALNAGTLYPILHKLEAQGAIKASWDESTGRPRKWYRLTAAGKRQLKTQTDGWRAYASAVEALLSPKPA